MGWKNNIFAKFRSEYNCCGVASTWEPGQFQMHTLHGMELPTGPLWGAQIINAEINPFEFPSMVW